MTLKTYNIKSLRANKGMTQQDLADKLGVTVKTVNDYENGNKEPKPLFRYALAYLFGVDANEIRM